MCTGVCVRCSFSFLSNPMKVYGSFGLDLAHGAYLPFLFLSHLLLGEILREPHLSAGFFFFLFRTVDLNDFGCKINVPIYIRSNLCAVAFRLLPLLLLFLVLLLLLLLWFFIDIYTAHIRFWCKFILYVSLFIFYPNRFVYTCASVIGNKL